MSMKDKVLLLTGAAGSIGQEIATQFLSAGASVLLLDTNEEALQKFHGQLESFGDRVASAVYDAASVESNVAAAQIALETFGRIDYVVPSAGIYPEGQLEQVSVQQWNQLMDINLNSAFYLLKEVIPHLEAGASIVLIGSVAGQRGSANHTPYAASKAALGGIARSLSVELGPRDIRVNVVAPGVIDNSMSKELRRDGDESLILMTPLGRLGRAAEVASVVHFLCSSGASYVSGETINVNGGMHRA